MSTGDRMIRVSTAAVVVAVGTIAAIVSYRHALQVVRDHGETGVTALLVPFTVDGLVYVAGMVLLDAARRGHRAPALARTALGLGIGATVAANVLHGIAHGPVGAAIAAWPAVTLTVVYELLMNMIRRGRVADAEPAVERATGPAAGSVSTTLAGPVDQPAGVDQVAEDDVVLDAESATPGGDDHAGQAPVQGLGEAVRSARAAGRSQRWIADEFGISRYRVRALLDGPAPTAPAVWNGDAPDG